MAQVRVDLKVTADQREVRRKHMGQQQVAEVVQQAGEVGQAGALETRELDGAPGGEEAIVV